ncbi:hypothetical protein D3C84_1304380 [compost metagenome]
MGVTKEVARPRDNTRQPSSRLSGLSLAMKSEAMKPRMANTEKAMTTCLARSCRMSSRK